MTGSTIIGFYFQQCDVPDTVGESSNSPIYDRLQICQCHEELSPLNSIILFRMT